MAGALPGAAPARRLRARSSRAVRGVASPSSEIFQPMQVFWFLGHHSPLAGSCWVWKSTTSGWRQRGSAASATRCGRDRRADHLGDVARAPQRPLSAEPPASWRRRGESHRRPATARPAAAAALHARHLGRRLLPAPVHPRAARVGDRAAATARRCSRSCSSVLVWANSQSRCTHRPTPRRRSSWRGRCRSWPAWREPVLRRPRSPGGADAPAPRSEATMTRGGLAVTLREGWANSRREATSDAVSALGRLVSTS